MIKNKRGMSSAKTTPKVQGGDQPWVDNLVAFSLLQQKYSEVHVTNIKMMAIKMTMMMM